MTGPAGDFAGTGAVAATGDSGNNPNANTTGPNSLTEPAIFISPRIGLYETNPRGIIPATLSAPLLFSVGFLKFVIPTAVKQARAVISARVGRRDPVFLFDGQRYS